MVQYDRKGINKTDVVPLMIELACCMILIASYLIKQRGKKGKSRKDPRSGHRKEGVNHAGGGHS